jgi:putative phosphoribosyl transferase
METFRNREEAGRLLAEALAEFAGRGDVIVLGLPRGGVPVAEQVARALDADLDVLVVRKLGHPYQPELAIGAIAATGGRFGATAPLESEHRSGSSKQTPRGASGGVRVLNEAIRIPANVLEELTRREEVELHRREQTYREGRPFPDLEDRVVILVDDGLATGSTMRAAVAAVRQMNPSRIIVAVPVAPLETVMALQREADEVVCLMTPSSFFGVGQFYQDFSQTSDEEVRAILRRFWKQTDRESAREPA